MRRKHLTLVALFCIISIPIAAQLDSFKLSDYKLPDLKRQGIDIEFGLIGSQSEENYIGEVGDFKESSFNSNLSASYIRYRNTRKYQGTLSTSLYGRYEFDKDKREDSDFHKYTDVSSGFAVQSYNRFYFNNNYFLGFRAYSSVSTNQYKDESDYYLNGEQVSRDENKRSHLYYSASLPISIGKGRIEPVEDARQTLYILKELKSQGRLKREPSKDEIIQISSQISRIKNERVLDSRLKKIYELKQLDSVLQSLDLIEQNDISYFTAINDMWDFGGLQYRSTGSTLSLSYEPHYSFSESVYKTTEINFPNLPVNLEDKYLSKNLWSALILGYTLRKPFRQKFQSDFSGSIKYGFYRTNHKSEDIQPPSAINESNRNSNYLSSSLSYSFGYYPNTRTDFSIRTHLFGTKYWNTDESDGIESDYEAVRYGANTSINMNYYISPKLRLSFVYRLYFNKDDNLFNTELQTENLRHFTSATLLYSIF